MRLTLLGKFVTAVTLATMATLGGTRAFAAGEMFSIQSPAVLQANGAGLMVTVQYSCPMTDTTAALGVSVSENVGGQIASGSAGAGTLNGGITCDGTAHLINLVMLANNWAFRQGSAFAQGSLDTCTVTCNGETQTQATRTIKLGKGIAASAASSTFSIAQTFSTQARGAGVIATLYYNCPPTATSASISISVSENVGGPTASANGSPFSPSLTCDGATHTFTMPMNASNRAFRDGQGFGLGSFGTCSPAGCSSESAYRTITFDDGDGQRT